MERVERAQSFLRRPWIDVSTRGLIVYGSTGEHITFTVNRTERRVNFVPNPSNPLFDVHELYQRKGFVLVEGKENGRGGHARVPRV